MHVSSLSKKPKERGHSVELEADGRIMKYRVRQKDIPYLERALCELWWGYGDGGGIDR
jgi:hypothetical protein